MEITLTRKFSDVKNLLDSHKNQPIICDLETSSLTPSKGKIICVALLPYKSDQVYIWFPEDMGDLPKLKLDKAIFHNAMFDVKWLEYYGSSVSVVWDTMIMAHLLDENRKIGLKDLGQRLLGYEDWALQEIGDLSHTHREVIAKYAAMDVWVTRDLCRVQRKMIRKGLAPGADPKWVMENLSIPAMRPLLDMETEGLPVLVHRIDDIYKEVESRMASIDQELDALTPPRDVWPDYLKTKSNPKWGSTNWTRWWLYDHLGASIPSVGKPSKHWPEGSPSLSQSALTKVAHPGAKLLQERSQLQKTLTGFLVPLKTREQDGKVFTSFKLTGTVTGRLSSASPASDNPGINCQQIPRDKKIRNLFGEKNKVWIEADFSQLELRVAARLAGEKTMLRLFEDNIDIHTYIAQQLVGKEEVTKEQRTLAKGVNFGFLYGMHAKHFANYLQEGYGIVISYDDAVKFRETYFKTFSGLDSWYKEQRKTALRYGGVSNAFGRFRHLPRVYSSDYWVQEAAFRQAINAPVQSTGSDFMLISLIRLSDNLALKKAGAKLVATVHDSVCLTAPARNAKKVAKIVKRVMESSDDVLDESFNLKADVSISRFWGGEPLAEF